MVDRKYSITLSGETFEEDFTSGGSYYLYYRVNGFFHTYSYRSWEDYVQSLTIWGTEGRCTYSVYRDMYGVVNEQYSPYAFISTRMEEVERELVRSFPEVERLEELQAALWAHVRRSVDQRTGPYDRFEGFVP